MNKLLVFLSIIIYVDILRVLFIELNLKAFQNTYKYSEKLLAFLFITIVFVSHIIEDFIKNV
jgi:hypothetical protein